VVINGPHEFEPDTPAFLEDAFRDAGQSIDLFDLLNSSSPVNVGSKAHKGMVEIEYDFSIRHQFLLSQKDSRGNCELGLREAELFGLSFFERVLDPGGEIQSRLRSLYFDHVSPGGGMARNK
jgi:hypothetical protein